MMDADWGSSSSITPGGFSAKDTDHSNACVVEEASQTDEEKKLKDGKSCIGDSRLESSNWTGRVPKGLVQFKLSNLESPMQDFPFFSFFSCSLRATPSPTAAIPVPAMPPAAIAIPPG